LDQNSSPSKASERHANGTTAIFFGLWRFLFRIESRDSPILIWSFLSAQNVEQAIGKGVTADFCADIDLTDNIAVFVELQDPVLVPLT